MQALQAPIEDLVILAQLPFFAETPETELHEIVASTRRRGYRRGEVIHHVDDMAGDVFVVRRGHVKHRQICADGRQFTHAINNPGDAFGLLSVIDRKRRAGDAVALTDCEILVIDRDAFAAYLRCHPEATEILLQHHVASLRHMQELVADMVFLSVPSRLAKILTRFACRNDSGPQDFPVIPAYLNQTELAFLVGTSRESVNQTLRLFYRHGWIESDRKQIRIVNPEGLRRVIG